MLFTFKDISRRVGVFCLFDFSQIEVINLPIFFLSKMELTDTSCFLLFVLFLHSFRGDEEEEQEHEEEQEKGQEEEKILIVI